MDTNTTNPTDNVRSALEEAHAGSSQAAHAGQHDPQLTGTDGRGCGVTIPSATPAQIMASYDLLLVAKAAAGVELCGKLVHMHASSMEDPDRPPICSRQLGAIGSTLDVLSIFIANHAEHLSNRVGAGDHWNFHTDDVFDSDWTPPDAREEHDEEATP